jgi:hypothetical protein
VLEGAMTGEIFRAYEPLAKRLVLSGLGGVADPVGESLMLHFVFWQRQIGNCRRASSGLCFRIGRHVSDAGRVLAAT